MRLSDLRGMEVVSADGDRLGRVHEVHCDNGKIIALMCGGANLLERWTGRIHGRRINWALIDRIERRLIVLKAAKQKPPGRQRR